MRKIIAIIMLTIFTVLSCKTKTEIIEGDLYFKLIDFGSFYGADKKQIEEFEKIIDSLRLTKLTSKNDQRFIEYYDNLKKYKLINYPCIKIKSDTIIRQIYLAESEYEKVKDYKWSDLRTKKKRVNLRIEVQKFDEKIFFSDKIIDFKEIEGETYWKK